MERYTKEQRILILKTYFNFGESFAGTVRNLRGIFGRGSAPNESTVRRVIAKFEETGSVMDARPRVYQRSARSRGIIAAVSESVAENPKTSIRHRSQQLGISRSSLQRILTNDLHAPQELQTTDHFHRQEGTQENVGEVVSGCDGDNILDAAETVREKETSTNRKTAKQEFSIETENTEVIPVKRGRGRAKEVAVEPPKKSKREVKNLDSKTAQDKLDHEKEEAPKRGEGRTKAAQKEEPEIVNKDSEPKVPRGATKKDSITESNGTEKPEIEFQASPSQSCGTKLASTRREASQEKAMIEVEKKPKKGRAKKTKPVIEENGIEPENKPVKIAGAKKILSGGRGRKREAAEPIEAIKGESAENDVNVEKEEIITGK